MGGDSVAFISSMNTMGWIGLGSPLLNKKSLVEVTIFVNGKFGVFRCASWHKMVKEEQRSCSILCSCFLDSCSFSFDIMQVRATQSKEIKKKNKDNYITLEKF